MSDNEFKAFMTLLMCSDPWPVPDQGEGDGEAVLKELAEQEAVKRGYTDWISAYHHFR